MLGRIIVFLLLTVLFFPSCNNGPKTAKWVLEQNLKATSKANNWNELSTAVATLQFSKYIKENKVVEENRVTKAQFPNKSRVETYVKDTLVALVLTDSIASLLVQFQKDIPVGYTKLERQSVFPNPAYELINRVGDLELRDTLWQNKTAYLIWDTKEAAKYIFNEDSFLLEAKEESNAYGTAITTFTTFKWVGDYLLPHKKELAIEQAQYKEITAYDEILVNTPVAESTFEKKKSWFAIAEGAQLPEFEIDLLSRKEKITNNDLKGKITLIDFWATWCKPCIEELPNIERNYENYKNKGFEVFSISMDADTSRLDKYLAENPFPWELSAHLQDGFKSQMAKDFQLIAIPKPVLVDANGKIIAMDTDVREENLEKQLNAIFND
ncbi:MAG: TlpA disulfide reductase family protein [Bacteroidota bacterium]